MEKDYTQGSLVRNIWDLALPGTGTHLLFSARGLLDAYWLGRLGSEELAAASMASSLRMMVAAVTMAVSIGGSALVARAVGSENQQRGSRAALQTLILVVGLVAVSAVVGFVWAEPLLRLIGAEGAVLSLGVQWMRVTFGGLLFIQLMQAVTQLLYGSGNPERVFHANLACIMCQAVLEPLLVLGWGPLPAMGIQGAALSQVLASAVAVGLQFHFLLAGKARVSLDRQDFCFELPVMGRIMKLAVPIVVARVVMSLGSPLTYRIIANYGVAVVAGYGVASRVFNFAFTLAAGAAMSPRSMVGQNLGAGQPGRAERAVWWAAGISATLTAIQIVTIMILAEPAMAIFNSAPAVIAAGGLCLRYLGLAQVAFIVTFTLRAALNGAGDTFSPMWISIGALWLLGLPLMYGLSHLLGWGAPGVWIGMGISHVIEMLALAMRFRQGRWKVMRV